MSIQINSSFRSTDIGKSPVSTFKRNSDGLEFPVMPRETDSPLMKRLIGGLTLHPHFGHPRPRGEVVNSILICFDDPKKTARYLMREQNQIGIMNLVDNSYHLAKNGVLTRGGQDALVISMTEAENIYYVGILERTNDMSLMFGAGVMIDSSRITY
ncbi:hypothetical protein A3J90_00235 [candidate division WOR-1 bacterium RIFOXYC2_FULL_37_10]|uniref:Uncharacterized protein n=1 Tax=candidate division WOR-1 bacterium RIFOXYB2_FULL_37_13 TaxID=1802579 RepID=A0A1F4SRR4_UNCSA|nr:MAG: hypothetical protein A2310_00880 [candidate division WOR-1 bacterium RIFOXYB2_FULL_37_13]OGC37291.1 MAG: hypothetical protein A3J90_00235 [candidate division WOR-1 bacterium RIFOXYC2_FULL_37_10]